MCGRYSLYSHQNTPEVFEERFDVGWPASLSFPPSYNIGPYRDVPIIFSAGEVTEIRMMQWQLIPSFSKTFKSSYAMFNTRTETIASKPFWQKMLRQSRCIFPINNFFEWKKAGKEKLPYKFFLPEQSLIGIGGLYAIWQNPDGEKFYSASMITVPANPVVGAVHNRMPFVLPVSTERDWLNKKLIDFETLYEMISIYPAEKMEAAPVSQAVNSIKNDSPELILPIAN